jgi:hypothetical protein
MSLTLSKEKFQEARGTLGRALYLREESLHSCTADLNRLALSSVCVTNIGQCGDVLE